MEGSSKKLLILCILEILKKYTDDEHSVRQQEIIDILESDYGMTCERKAVARNINTLADSGYDIKHSGKGCYLAERDFENSEIRLLIDSLLAYKNIPYSQCRDLIEKLRGLASKYFHAQVNHIRSLSDRQPENREMFYIIDVLDEAIEKGLQVSFCYNSYGADKRLHPRLDDTGAPRRYTINPYQMVVSNGRYYLICNNDKYDSLANYRLDKISDIKLTSGKVKAKSLVKGLEDGLDMPKHMAEHIYMFSGDSINVRFRISAAKIGEVIDWFGRDTRISEQSDGSCIVSVRVNEEAMLCWAMQYGRFTEVISPASLREKVIAAAKQMCANYGV